jgi:hypothetical protein
MEHSKGPCIAHRMHVHMELFPPRYASWFGVSQASRCGRIGRSNVPTSSPSLLAQLRTRSWCPQCVPNTELPGNRDVPDGLILECDDAMSVIKPGIHALGCKADGLFAAEDNADHPETTKLMFGRALIGRFFNYSFCSAQCLCCS